MVNLQDLSDEQVARLKKPLALRLFDVIFLRGRRSAKSKKITSNKEFERVSRAGGTEPVQDVTEIAVEDEEPGNKSNGGEGNGRNG